MSRRSLLNSVYELQYIRTEYFIYPLLHFGAVQQKLKRRFQPLLIIFFCNLFSFFSQLKISAKKFCEKIPKNFNGKFEKNSEK